ncbi:hypothetical protein ACFYO1_17235 [Nocardia sp. NPDC006044]|uniref:hypothetical protein n=1 Tax=Nocardia sp. NPDC006044 TaxID=3364306 RepID=UPI0036B70383
MGAVSWMAFRGKDFDEVCAELGLRRTGERVEYPRPHAVATELASGWLIVVLTDDSSEFAEEEAKALALERLSAGCEVVSCTLDNYSMYADVAGWRDGARVWSVVRDSPVNGEYDDLRVEGQLPPHLWDDLDELLAEQRGADDRDEVDYLFDAPEQLGWSLTGFRHSPRFGEPRPEFFEVLDRPAIGDLLALTSDAIGYALAAQGFRAVDELDIPWAEEYVPTGRASGLVVPTVRVFLERSQGGEVAVSAAATVISPAAREVLLTLPPHAWLEYDTEEFVRRSTIDSIGFGRFEDSWHFPGALSEQEFVTDGGHGVEWVLGYVAGPVVRWHAERDTVAKLAHLARVQNEGGYVDAERLRGTVVLCLLDGAARTAADLMAWYLSLERYYARESRERAAAFDQALRDRFPGYARLRGVSG